ncbi:zinc ABC transporter substrate-binding protein [Antarctobacter sp.]|uniref:zinc ABC transporter substrate-binding protein n=1 Tax=Antarctobacter sp. TaxID=1872577 RepID=UPI002B275A49|nr:zinc ABC transporter substrate-binding protein [Antarctobacter sp.]
MLRPILFAASLTLALPALAEVPQVVTDIGPVESLTAMVMGDLGAPDRLLQPGASPHHMALKPSQARALSGADVVIWIGPDLTPQLAGQIGTLATSARSLPLAELPATHLLPARDTGLFPHDHDHDHDEDDHAEHDDHDDDHHDDHGTHDPHVWLSPENATLWLSEIAEALAETDPDNAETYRANARAGTKSIAKAEAEARATLALLDGRPLAVAHDAYQYFEDHFDLTVLGAISDAEANTPGPARLAALRDGLAADKPACLLIEPGTDPRLLDIVEGSGVPTATLDPLGTNLPQGATLYPALIADMARRIITCAGR